jgi:flap endonuclease-1
LPKDGKVPVPEEYQEIRKIFLEPEVTDDYKLVWGSVHPEAVRKIMCDRHSFSVDRIDAVTSKIVSLDASRSQMSLDSWS